VSEILVSFYSGHRRSSYPRALVIDGKEVLVQSIIRHEITEDFASRQRKHVFFVRVREEVWEIVRHDDESTACRKLG
jgi:hypothetical protein